MAQSYRAEAEASLRMCAYSFGSTGPSGTRSNCGVHFHDLLQLPEWSKVGSLLQQSLSQQSAS